MSERGDDLSLWEVNRKPRRLERKDRRIRCQSKLLNPHLKCAICLSYLNETTIVNICGHRFCSACINRCIQSGKRQCPHCRKFIPSRRSLRRDTKYDEIVNSIVGDPEMRQNWEKQQGQNDAKKMVHLQRAIKTNHIVEREKRAAAAASAAAVLPIGKHQQQRSSSSLFQNNSGGEARPRKPRSAYAEESPLIEIELRRHPSCCEGIVETLNRPFLTIHGDANVSLLQTFLRKKLASKSNHNYEITLDDKDNNTVVLDADLTLVEAKRTLCPRDNIMVLKYRIPRLGDDDDDDDFDNSSDEDLLSSRKFAANPSAPVRRHM